MSNWVNTNQGLYKKLIFKSSIEQSNFLKELDIVSEKANHHADIKNISNIELDVYLLTHDTGKVGVKDEDLARKIDLILKNLK